jgi:hypothetical protein
MTAQDSSSDSTDLKGVPIITDAVILLRHGVIRAAIPESVDTKKWAAEFSQVTPEIMAGEGDSEYAFYRNILEEPDFPFDAILGESSKIREAILQHFDISNTDELRLDDAFCVHYNEEQDDTSGAKHIDPSDITINICLEKTDGAQGSHVLFYGTKQLRGASENDELSPERFLVSQDPGYATIHWGNHPHETMALKSGKRTNIVMTFCYTDATRSDVGSRTCYA